MRRRVAPPGAVEFFRIADSRQVGVAELHRAQLVERGSHAAGIPEVAMRPGRPVNRALGEGHPDLHQPVRLRKDQRLQQDGVDHAEDDRVRADTQRQRGHRDRDEARDTAKRLEALLDVSEKCHSPTSARESFMPSASWRALQSARHANDS